MIVPVVATIFLLIFVANMVKLVPGFESIGWLEEAHKGYGYGMVKLFTIGGLSVYSLDSAQRTVVQETNTGHEDTAAAETSEEVGKQVSYARFAMLFHFSVDQQRI